MWSTRRRYLSGAAAVATAGVSGCTGNRSRVSEFTLRVGSKSFTEQEILGYLAYHRLRELPGSEVVNRVGQGDSLTNWESTKRGETDLYWEYTGTAWRRLPPYRDERLTDERELYEHVATDAGERGIEMAEPAGFSNEYVLVADVTWSEITGVETIRDLTTHVANGNTGFGMAVNGAFFHRRDGWPGLLSYYGVDEATQATIEAEAFVVTSIGLTYELLRSGDVAVASGFATDPQLDRDTLVVLEDDGEFFLPYTPAPTAHAATIDSHPEVFEALSPVVEALDEATMRRLNRAVLIDGRGPSAVAESFLREEVS